MMYLIDVNVFLEVLLQQDRWTECEEFLEKVGRGEISAYVSRFGLYSIELIMIRYGRFDGLRTFLKTLATFKGLSIVTTSIADDLHVLDHVRNLDLHFDDALNYFVANKYGLRGIVSFDRHFDKTDLKRYEPKEFVTPGL